MTETSFTVYLVAAIALHLVPLLAIDPEPETIELEDESFRHRPCNECEDIPVLEPEALSKGFDLNPRTHGDEDVYHHDPRLTREQAIEMARSAGFLGPTRRHVQHRRERLMSVDDEITLEVVSCCWHYHAVWRVKEVPLFPQIRRGLSAPTHVDVGRVMVAGSLDRSVVRRYVWRHARELAACIEPGTTKAIDLPFLITASGSVNSAHSERPEPGRQCFEDVISKIVFPPSNGHTQVHISLALDRESLRYGILDNRVTVR